MVRVRDLSQQEFRNMARLVRIRRAEGKSDRIILVNLQISRDDLSFIEKFNDRTDHPVGEGEEVASTV